MKTLFEKKISGLAPLQEDSRDLFLGQVYKTIPAKEIPMLDFVVSVPLGIKDQADTDMCTAYAITSVSEDQEGVQLSPEYQFARTKQLLDDKDSWGADLRTACKVPVKFGSLQQRIATEYMNNKNVHRLNRDWIADWKNWSLSLDYSAFVHKKKTYLSIAGENLFEAILSSLWTFKDEKRTVVTGCMWYENYTFANQGIIPEQGQGQAFGHAFKIFGQRIIGGKRYLVAQLSNGLDIGDNGLFYFSEVVVNRDFKFGAFMFQDVSPDDARDAQNTGVAINEKWYNKVLLFIKKIFV